MAKKKGMGKGFTPIKNASLIGAGKKFEAVKNEQGQTLFAPSILKQRGQAPPTQTTTPQAEQKPVEQKKEAPKTEILKPQTPQQQQQKQEPSVTKSIAQVMSEKLKSTMPKVETEKKVAPVSQSKSVSQKMSEQLKAAKEQPVKAQSKEVKPIQKEVKKEAPKAVKPPTIKR